MLYCTLLLLKGSGSATLKCKTQPHVGTTVDYTLHDLPQGGVLVWGDGKSRHWTTATAKKGRWQGEALSNDGLWAAYLDAEGKMLAWGTADGLWHDFVAAELYEYAAQSLPAAPQETAPEATTPPDGVDLSDFGVVGLDETPTIEALPEDMPEPARDEQTEPTITAEVQTDDEAQGLPLADLAPVLESFDYYPPYPPLEALMEGSRWVQVGEGDSRYFLGLLYDSTPTLTHLCYGVQGWRQRPFSPNAEWLGDGDEGYWVVYHEVLAE